MELHERVIKVLDLLEKHYGPTKCYLTHENAWQLLIATILSAQCTDDRVNIPILRRLPEPICRNWSRIYALQDFTIIRQKI